mmetsp:Transcript_31264/g.99997  ORF Transcript_31264/g.99997 Transcript_31264/m.99997 type:complete len:238 (-) Transcript_31264:259-972(-)
MQGQFNSKLQREKREYYTRVGRTARAETSSEQTILSRQHWRRAVPEPSPHAVGERVGVGLPVREAVPVGKLEVLRRRVLPRKLAAPLVKRVVAALRHRRWEVERRGEEGRKGVRADRHPADEDVVAPRRRPAGGEVRGGQQRDEDCALREAQQRVWAVPLDCLLEPRHRLLGVRVAERAALVHQRPQVGSRLARPLVGVVLDIVPAEKRAVEARGDRRVDVRLLQRALDKEKFGLRL